MQLSLKSKTLLALAIQSAVICGQNAVAAEIALQHQPLKYTVPVAEEKLREYFVRLQQAPLSQWMKKTEQIQGAALSVAAVQTRGQALERAVAEAAAVYEAAGLKVGNISTVSDLGFSVYATKSQIEAVAKVPGIAKVVPKINYQAQRDFSTPWIGAGIAHESKFKGANKTIAIIDTGIDYTHQDFGGNGDFDSNDGTIVESGSFPTQRVTGGFDFVGFDYDASSNDPAEFIPQPDNDPIDDGVHGTHVAGIAGGGGIDGTIDVGIAPEAELLALKVFGQSGSTSLTADAIEMAMDPNGDGDPSDAVDVINMSLGSAFGDPFSATAVAAQNASDSGIVVVASAGNSGNTIPFVSGAPGSAEDVISVASTLSGGIPELFVPVLSDSGESLEFFATYAAISPPLVTVNSGAAIVAAPYDACTPLEQTMSGEVALITRGTCAFSLKLQHALDAGASAALVVNNVPGPAIAMGGSAVDIPSAMISLSDGEVLLAELAENSVEAELAPDNIKANPADDDTMSGFSSRGPGPSGLFKPDLAAPGSAIESALAGSGDGTLALSGTSMAAPQVAGMAAILLEKFPGFAPREIKAIMQNNSVPAKVLGVPGASPPLSLQGTGIVDIEQALNATSYASPGGISFGQLNPEYNESVNRELTIKNFSDRDKRYQISHEPNQQLPDGAARLSYNQEVYVAAGKSVTIPVQLHIQANRLQSGPGFTEIDGWLVASAGDESLRVGYMAVVEPASRLDFIARKNELGLRNVAFGDARVFPYTLAGENSAAKAGTDDVQSFGFRTVNPLAVAFAVNVSNDWSNFSRKALNMFIDVDEDANPDFLVEVADLGILSNDGFNGTVVSAITPLGSATRSLLYVAGAETSNSVMQFQLDAYGDFGFLEAGDTTFSYELVLQDLVSGESGESFSGFVDLAEQASFSIPAGLGINVPAQQSETVTVEGAVKTLWLSPTEVSAARAVIR